MYRAAISPPRVVDSRPSSASDAKKGQMRAEITLRNRLNDTRYIVGL